MRQNRTRAFTLIEIILVIALIGLLAGAASLALVKTSDRAKIDITYTYMNTIKQGLDQYKIRNGQYPTTIQGLGVLVGGYLEQRALTDPWKVTFAYYSPVQGIDAGFDLRSNGPDGQAQTEDDLSIWDPR